MTHAITIQLCICRLKADSKKNTLLIKTMIIIK